MSGIRRTSEAGFTLVETLVASALLAVGMFALIGMQVTTINANRFSGSMTQALMLAESEATRLEALAWDHSDLGGPSKATKNNLPYGSTFPDPLMSADDPTSVADRCEGLIWQANGTLSVVVVGQGTFQRCTQLDGEDLNPAIAGIDSLRARVFVRFKDINQSGGWRISSITVLKPKVF